MLERSQLDRPLGLVRKTRLGRDLILIGSAAMCLAPTRIPPMTADADFAVRTEVLAQHLSGFLSDLREQGFEQVEETATFTHPEGFSFGLLALDSADRGDHLVRVGGMVLLAFADLCRLLEREDSVREVAGASVLGPAALALSKLRTWRVDKGTRDKIQALALLGDLSGDPRFLAEVKDLVDEVTPSDWEDLLADAQAAFAGLDAEEGRAYARFGKLVAKGFECLLSMRSMP